MSSGHRTIVLAGLAASLAACATLEDKQWSQEAKSASAKAFNVASHSTAKVLQRTQRYLAEQDVLMKFHDAGEHSEKEVLDNHDAHETRRHVAASGD